MGIRGVFSAEYRRKLQIMVQKHSARLSWDDLEAILLVGRHGSVRAAAEQIGVAHTTLAKRISAAERSLGIVAFIRSAKGYRATEAGRTVIAHAERMSFEANAVTRHVGGVDEALSGTVKISLLGTVLSHILAPHLNSFSIRYPQITLEFIAEISLADLNRQKADIVVRFQDNPREDLYGRRVAEMRSALYCGLQFDETLYGTGQAIPVIGWGRGPRVLAEFRDLGLEKPDVRWCAADVATQVAIAKAGAGVANLPCYVGDSEPMLRRLNPERTRHINDVWVLTHDSLKSSERVRVVFDFLAQLLRQDMGRFYGAVPTE
jgi:DNA-binding transcriptional LysR family regulator